MDKTLITISIITFAPPPLLAEIHNENNGSRWHWKVIRQRLG